MKSSKYFSAVFRASNCWRKIVNKHGVIAIEPKPWLGRTPRLNEKQLNKLKRLLKKGATKFGYANAIWTSRRVKQLIKDQFDVSYSKAQTCRLLRKIGDSPKKPVMRSKKYSQQAIKKWRQSNWPRIKKARDNGWGIVFIDESGFSLIPFLLRSWSPINEPDVLIESEKRAHLSSIGLVLLSPLLHRMRFFTTTFPGSAKSAEMSYVLDELHKLCRGKVIIIWDNLQGHKGLETKYSREHPDWFLFERLPTYSPELNIVEPCWNHTKNVCMANFVAKNQKQVVEQVELATQVINKNKVLLPAFLKHTKLKR